jgi:hypothetical protein
MTTATREQTPTFDALVAELGDPVVRPAIDRSYATLVKLATRPEKKASPKQAPKAKVATSTTKTDQNTDHDSATTDQVENDADSKADRESAPSPA